MCVFGGNDNENIWMMLLRTKLQIKVMIEMCCFSLSQVLQHIERSDLGCGRGGGKNNADVFDRAGLMFITNANAMALSAGTCSLVKSMSEWDLLH